MAKTKEDKMISINALESVAFDNIVRVPLGDENESIVVIKKTLTMREMLGFVQSVVDLVVDIDEAEYHPEYLDYLVREYTIKYYSNVRLPDKSENSYNLIYNTNIYDIILENIIMRDYERIINAINEKIVFECELISSNAFKQTNELIKNIENMVKSFDDMFGGINSDELATLVSGLSKIESFDEREIANAVLDRIASDNNNDLSSDNDSDVSIKLVESEN